MHRERLPPHLEMSMIDPNRVPEIDAMLRALDPRLTDQVRQAALSRCALTEAKFVIGALVEIVGDYHARAEALAGHAPGHFVDLMRRRYLGDLGDDLLGYALNDAAAGEPVSVRVTNPGALSRAERQWLARQPDGTVAPTPPESPDYWALRRAEAERDAIRVEDLVTPKRPEDLPVGTRRGTGPNGEWTVVDAAAAAEQARRARQEAEFASNPPSPGYGDQTGGQAVSGDLRAVSEPSHEFPVQDFTENGVTVLRPEDPRMAELLDKLNRDRREQAAVESADLDDPRSVAAVGQTQADVHSYDGNDQQTVTCGVLTVTGPCVLASGHPSLPIPGTQDGHMSERMRNGE